MKLNCFEVVSGRYIEEISGQSRIGYAMSDTTDFYDMVEWLEKGGYQGATISFYDYSNGKVYEPFEKHYPESFRFSTNFNESVCMIADGKVYLSAWVEEGWDDENDCETEEYKYYDKVIVRDFKGNVLSEMLGSIAKEHTAVTIVGGADGPTSVFVVG